MIVVWHYGNTNIYEAIRVILSMLVVVAGLFAALNAHQGEMLIPRVRRNAVRTRRIIQMFGFCIVGILLGSQSLFIASLPDPDEMPFSTLTGQITIILALFTIFILTILHIVGWWREGSILRKPMQPDDYEKKKSAIELGRELGHSFKNLSAISIGHLELLLEDPFINQETKDLAQTLLQNIEELTEKAELIHDQIRSIQ